MSTLSERNGIHLGRLLDVPTVPLVLDGRGLTAHTLIVGQSGSGKSFMLGRLLEEIVVATDGRLLILDPNSDFLRFSEIDSSAWTRHKTEFETFDDQARFAASWNATGSCLLTKRDGLELCSTVSPFVIPWTPDASAFDLAQLLGFDARTEAEEVLAIGRALASGETGTPASLKEFSDIVQKQWQENNRRDASESADGRLFVRAREHERLELWGDTPTTATVPSVVRELFQATPAHRIVILDIASLPTPDARLTVTQAALQGLWEAGRAAWANVLTLPQEADPRRPVFVVIDEAHNLAPAEARMGLQSAVGELLRRIATEGRKYAIYLILVTQRPGRLDETIRSQCDNLCLMKMNDRHELALIEASFGFIPTGWAQRALEFRKGDILLAGGLTDRPAYVHVAPRRTIEGGRSPQAATWLPHVARSQAHADPSRAAI
jgi:DNA helicase HerA-like ATPase